MDRWATGRDHARMQTTKLDAQMLAEAEALRTRDLAVFGIVHADGRTPATRPLVPIRRGRGAWLEGVDATLSHAVSICCPPFATPSAHRRRHRNRHVLVHVILPGSRTTRRAAADALLRVRRPPERVFLWRQWIVSCGIALK